VQDLFGGSSEKSQGSSGFALLPKEIQDAFKKLASAGTSTLLPGGTPNASAFNLPNLNPASTSALSQIQNQDFAVTPESIKSNVNAQMNPYNDSVISQIERAQNGKLSQLNSYLTSTGTYGSNRGELGANDISQSAADQVGSFLSNQFNTNLNNAISVIPTVNAQSAAGSVSAGQTQQQQTLQNQQAPISALQALAQIMGVLPQTGGSQQSGSGTSSKGIFSSIPLLGH
jgi:hypothetical protein